MRVSGRWANCLFAGFLFTGLVIASAEAYPYLRQQVAVDACLDRGGSFDYEHEVCDLQRSHAKHSVPLNSAAVGAGLGITVASAIVMLLRRDATP